VNRRIGVLGGTFNPVHNGHLYIARLALKKLKLNKVIFIPTFIPPHKKVSQNVKASDRLKMLRLALGKKTRFGISTYEIKKKGKSYSIRTALYLKRKYGKDTKLFFLIGSDCLKGLSKWKNVKKLMRIMQFVVIPRPGHKDVRTFGDIRRINIPMNSVSSTKVRCALRKNRSASNFLPKSVEDYIKRKKLYAK